PKIGHTRELALDHRRRILARPLFVIVLREQNHRILYTRWLDSQQVGGTVLCWNDVDAHAIWVKLKCLAETRPSCHYLRRGCFAVTAFGDPLQHGFRSSRWRKIEFLGDLQVRRRIAAQRPRSLNTSDTRPGEISAMTSDQVRNRNVWRRGDLPRVVELRLS